MSEEDYLMGWNDRREREKAILDATSRTNLTEAQEKLLSQIRADLSNDGARFDEEN